MRRGEHNRLGDAVRLGTVRSLGSFLLDPIGVPEVVADYLAAHLGTTDHGVLAQYARREATNREHSREIQV
ncbi:DUF4158 domain-containing protein [Cryobacterium sp. Hz9]|uniref:DUF4158 domain-containing protein n=1 Tax=Cryobacterium sp. Hz9 TaxID=1259167 RepID=UPI00106ACA1A|nr:DUF4158 domain-containing protein [Cryobacterium sp. Hz9]